MNTDQYGLAEIGTCTYTCLGSLLVSKLWPPLAKSPETWTMLTASDWQDVDKVELEAMISDILGGHEGNHSQDGF